MKDKRVMNRCIHFVVKTKESLEFLSLLLEFGKFLEVFIWVCFGFYRFRIFMRHICVRSVSSMFFLLYQFPILSCELLHDRFCDKNKKKNSMVHESKICSEILLSWLNEFVLFLVEWLNEFVDI